MRPLLYAVFVFLVGMCRLDVADSRQQRKTSSTQSPYDNMPHCGQFCGYDGQQHGQQTCQENQWCCGTETDRYCCNTPADYNPALASDSYCPPSYGWFVEWWYILVPMCIITTLLLTMALCYACRYHSIRPRGRTDAQASRGLDRQSPATVDFDPTSTFAFEPPPYDTLPKDPPTYNDICLMAAYENVSFVRIDDETAGTSGSGERRTTRIDADDRRRTLQLPSDSAATAAAAATSSSASESAPADDGRLTTPTPSGEETPPPSYAETAAVLTTTSGQSDAEAEQVWRRCTDSA